MPRTIIVGAGAAGLAAAAALGHDDFVVIEARERTGGRVHTAREPFGPVELGAAWFHEAEANPLVAVAAAAGIDAPFDDDSTRLYGDALDGFFDPGALPQAAQFGAWRAAQPNRPLPEAVAAFADAHGLDAAATAQLTALEQLQQLPNGLPFAQLPAHYPAGGGRDRAVEGGYDQVLKAVATDVPAAKIRLGEPVTEIAVTGAGSVEVRTAKDSYAGDAVIVAVPVGVLKAGSIQFTGRPLPEKVTAAIRNTSVGALNKVWLEFADVFWPPSFKKTVVVGEQPALVYNWHAVHAKARNVLGVIVCNDVARAVEAEPARAFELVRPYLERVKAPGSSVPKAPKNVLTSAWLEDPYSRGAYSTYAFPHERAPAVAAFEHGAAPIFFAGEHATTQGATFVHGAYLSGRRAAQQATSAQKL